MMLSQWDLSEKIIGCAFNVYNSLGYGFLESVYEKALMMELQEAGLSAVAQKSITVWFKGREIGDFTTDIIVEDSMILELKSVEGLNTKHEVQLVNYLVATRMGDGLLINFSPDSVEVKRKFNSINSNPPNPVHPVKKTMNQNRRNFHD